MVFAKPGEKLDQDTRERNKRTFNEGAERLVVFLGAVAAGSSRTRFLVYSRQWPAEDQELWVATTEKRFPALTGRLYTFSVPVTADGTGSFKDEETAKQIVQKVIEVLGLE